MSSCPGKELQNAGMKEAGLMGEMITCPCYKNGWSGEDGSRGNWRQMDGFFFFFLWGHDLKEWTVFFFSLYFKMKWWVSSLIV